MVKFDIRCPECKGRGKIKVNLSIKIIKPKEAKKK